MWLMSMGSGVSLLRRRVNRTAAVGLGVSYARFVATSALCLVPLLTASMHAAHIAAHSNGTAGFGWRLGTI
jgi:hypothetical protein